MRTFIYSLRTVNDRSILSIDLMGKLISETQTTITLNLSAGVTDIYKPDYFNKMKVYDDTKVFFIICSKNVSRESAFECLMQYALEKTIKRRDNLNELINRFEKELCAA